MAVKKSTKKTSAASASKVHPALAHYHLRKHPRGSSGKRLLTHDQEFEIMKLVLDKFLWVGLAVMVYGIWKLVSVGMAGLLEGLGFIVVGAVVLMLFMAILVKEFEFIE